MASTWSAARRSRCAPPMATPVPLAPSSSSSGQGCSAWYERSDRSGYLTPDRYPAEARLVCARADDPAADVPTSSRTYAVVKNHSFAHDCAWTRRLLASDVPYIGVLGPAARVSEILRQVGAEGDERVFAEHRVQLIKLFLRDVRLVGVV